MLVNQWDRQTDREDSSHNQTWIRTRNRRQYPRWRAGLVSGNVNENNSLFTQQQRD